jgi:hypothetical protein
MGLAHWRTPDVRFAALAGDPTHHCASAVGDDGSTIELRLYLPRRAWRFTFTRKRTAAVEFRGIVQADDDRDQIGAASGL